MASGSQHKIGTTGFFDVSDGEWIPTNTQFQFSGPSDAWWRRQKWYETSLPLGMISLSSWLLPVTAAR